MRLPVVDAPVPIARRPRGGVDRATASRIARLSRAAHRFHRFAHHPLCARYAGEVLRVGRVRVCRGCTFAIAGGLAGGVAGLAIGASRSSSIAAAIAGLALLAVTLYLPGRPPKTVSRLAPAALLALALTCAVLGRDVLGLAAAAAIAAAVLALRLLYGRRGADRSPCRTCPERDDSPCSGFRAIVWRERAVQRVTRRWLSPRGP